MFYYISKKKNRGVEIRELKKRGAYIALKKRFSLPFTEGGSNVYIILCCVLIYHKLRYF